MPLDDQALICAFDFDADGAARALSADAASGPRPAEGWRWVHCERLAPATRRFVEGESGLPELASEALLDEETRPRVEASPAGLLIILRGVNLNPGADPEDMVALRMWVRPDFVLSLRKNKVFSVQAIREGVEAGERLASPGAFMAEDEVDELEARSLDRDVKPIRQPLTEVRRDVIFYRRFLGPQRDAIAKLLALSPAWLDEAARAQIRESLDDLSRVIEVLDSVRDRAALLQEALANRRAEEMNRTMYVLSMVAAIFLPLGFLTGLLGINVGGIPGTESPLAFAVVCVITVGIVAAQVVVFRRMGWM